VVSANHQQPHTPPTMTSLMTLCNIPTVNMVNKFSDDQCNFIQSILLPLLIRIFVRPPCCHNIMSYITQILWQLHDFLSEVFWLTDKPRLLLFCFTCKHAETKLKQNNITETKYCFAFVLFQFYLRCNQCIIAFLLLIRYTTLWPWP